MPECEVCGENWGTERAKNVHKTMKHDKDNAGENNVNHRPFKERFFEKIEVNEETGCWEWQGAINGKGYGTVHHNFEEKPAQWASFIEFKDEDIGDDWVLHHCDNRKCVNPEHLYLGNQSDNMKDAYRRNRKTQVGEENGNSKLTEQEVKEIYRIANNSDKTQKEIGKEYGVTRERVSAIKRKITWRNVLYDTDEDGE